MGAANPKSSSDHDEEQASPIAIRDPSTSANGSNPPSGTSIAVRYGPLAL